MKKIISITLLFILIASVCYNSFAFEIGEKDLKLIKQCEGYLKYQGSEKKAPYVVYQNLHSRKFSGCKTMFRTKRLIVFITAH